MSYHVAILWGSSGFGFWLAKFLLKHYGGGMRLMLTWRHAERGTRAAASIGAVYTSDNTKAVSDADITIIAVKISCTGDVVREIAPFLKKGSVLLDVTSVKMEPTNTMRECVSEDVLVIPTHPMFGPYLETLEGQMVVLTPYDDRVFADARYQWFKGEIKRLGANIIETTAEEHDTMMSIVQGMTHFSLFVMAETIRRLGVNVRLTHGFSSPIYRILIAMVERYIHQKPELYTDIQLENPKNEQVYQAFLWSAAHFAEIVRRRDHHAFIETVYDCKNFFWEEAEKGQEFTDKIIFLLSREREKLHRAMVSWASTPIKNIHTNETRTVRITRIGSRSFFDEEKHQYFMRQWILDPDGEI